MKSVKKIIRELRSRDKSPTADKYSNAPTTQDQYGVISNDSNTLQTGVHGAEPPALEAQHGVSDELAQTKASDITDVTQDIDPDLIEKFGRFTILIIGRANAGKMTILQRICKSTEYPEIYNNQGKRVEAARERGIHDINNRIVFKSNRKFVFHDFPGFETGHEAEFEQLKRFVTERADATFPRERIRAIWYCIPMDQIHRALTIAEEKFFNECNTKNVPVLVLFTKYDALVTQAFQPEHLLLSPEDQLKVLRERSQEMFRKRDIWGDLCKMRFPPQASVQLENMHKSDDGCNILLEKTAAALSNESQMLLVSAQEKDI